MPFVKTVDVDAVKLVLQKWINAVINPNPAPVPQTKVIFDWQDAPRPGKPFVSYRMMGSEKPAITEDVLFEMGLPFLEGMRVFHVEVQAYSDGEEATDIIAALQSSFEQPQFYKVFENGSTGINPTPDPLFACSVAQVRDPVDLTELLETKYERRVMLEFDLIVSAIAAIDDGTPAKGGIAHVDIQGEGLAPGSVDIEMDVKTDKP